MKQKNQLTVLGTLVVVMLLVWYFNRPKPEVAAGSTAVQNYQLLAVENPQLHREKMEAAQKTEYHSAGRNPFSEIAPPTPAEQRAKQVAEVHNRIVGPEPLPPIPPPTLPASMKFFGYGTVPNGTSKRAFLSDGDEVYIVAEGDTLLGRYRIVKITNANLEFEEISSGRRNTVALVPDEQAATPAA
jgi:hypothetical protein